MNILSKFRLPLFLLTVVAVMTSCSDNDEATPVVPVASKTIVDVAVADPQFSILVSALQKADLVNTLK
jgi:transforming growth factor-beta-induced protein